MNKNDPDSDLIMRESSNRSSHAGLAEEGRVGHRHRRMPPVRVPTKEALLSFLAPPCFFILYVDFVRRSTECAEATSEVASAHRSCFCTI